MLLPIAPNQPVTGTTPASTNTPNPIPEGPLREATFDSATGMVENVVHNSGITITIRRIEWVPQSGLWLDIVERRFAELV